MQLLMWTVLIVPALCWPMSNSVDQPNVDTLPSIENELKSMYEEMNMYEQYNPHFCTDSQGQYSNTTLDVHIIAMSLSIIRTYGNFINFAS